MLDESGNLGIVFDVKIDKLIIVNMINYVIFDLGGEGLIDGVLGYVLMILVKVYILVDVNLILIGELKLV
ncbi:galactose-1-epimerase, partial [Enterococcus hirae]